MDYENRLIYFVGEVNAIEPKDGFSELIVQVPHTVDSDGLVRLKYFGLPAPIIEGDSIHFVAEIDGLSTETEMPELSVRALKVAATMSDQ